MYTHIHIYKDFVVYQLIKMDIISVILTSYFATLPTAKKCLLVVFFFEEEAVKS